LNFIDKKTGTLIWLYIIKVSVAIFCA